MFCFYTVHRFYSKHDAELLGREIDLKQLQLYKDRGLFVGWQNVEVFAVSPERRVLVNVTVPSF